MVSETGHPWIFRLLTLAVVIALFWPVVRNNDGLPLSTYPMYAGTRPHEVTFVVATGVTRSGDPTTLSMPEIASTRDPLVAQAFLNDAVARGDTDRICREIALRVGDEIGEIEIASELHDVVKHASGEPSLIERDLHSRCSVAA